MTPEEQKKRDHARARLLRFTYLAGNYRAAWGLGLDRETFLNLWAQARVSTGQAMQGQTLQKIK